MFFVDALIGFLMQSLLIVSYIPPPKITGNLLKKANVLLGAFAAMMVTKATP